MESTKESINQESHKPIRVLVADDDPPTRLLLKAAIVRWGYQVVEASDGEQAWETIHTENSPEILILDWLMPKLDGIGLCERIKEQQLTSKPYIILLTQISGTQNIVKGLEAGADEYLSKPFNMAELRSRLSVGAKLINNKNQLKNYISKVDQLIEHVSAITLQISSLLDKRHPKDSSAGSDSDVLKKLVALNFELEESLHVLKDFNKFVRNSIKGPLK